MMDSPNEADMAPQTVVKPSIELAESVQNKNLGKAR
jgi:hypothetical protein